MIYLIDVLIYILVSQVASPRTDRQAIQLDAPPIGAQKAERLRKETRDDRTSREQRMPGWFYYKP